MKAKLIRPDLRHRNPYWNEIEFRKSQAAVDALRRKAHAVIRRAKDAGRMTTPDETAEITRLYQEARAAHYTVPKYVQADAGYVREHWDAHKLVRMGVAEPDDKECADVAGMTDDEMAAAQVAAGRARKGIAPEDFEAFDAGRMDGYDDDGNPTLGGERVDDA